MRFHCSAGVLVPHCPWSLDLIRAQCNEFVNFGLALHLALETYVVRSVPEARMTVASYR